MFSEFSLFLSCQQVLFFATSYVIPLALICGLYLCMLLRLWRGVAPGGHVSAESRRGKKRVTRMVVVVVAIFAICWFPIQVQYLSVNYHPVGSLILYHVPYKTRCTFYRVPEHDSCMANAS
jgi:allatostatin receptor